jgi:HAD superfamily hydrolase (TIGR01509 family)
MKKLFIFDMDGVIIDSEHLYRDLNRKILNELDAEYDEEVYKGFVGIASDKMWSRIKEDNKLNQSLTDLMKYAQDKKYSLLQNTDFKPNVGITELLDEIKNRNASACIASSAQMRNIHLIIEKISLSKYFDFSISGEDIENGKPEPDIFIKAAQTAGVESNECIVIEDSRNGIIAANKAGMSSVGFKNNNSGDQDLSGSDLIVIDFSEENRNKILNL